MWPVINPVTAPVEITGPGAMTAAGEGAVLIPPAPPETVETVLPPPALPEAVVDMPGLPVPPRTVDTVVLGATLTTGPRAETTGGGRTTSSLRRLDTPPESLAIWSAIRLAWSRHSWLLVTDIRLASIPSSRDSISSARK